MKIFRILNPVTYTTIMQEAKNFSPGCNDVTALKEYLLMLEKTQKYCASMERKLNAANKMQKASELDYLFTVLSN